MLLHRQSKMARMAAENALAHKHRQSLTRVDHVQSTGTKSFGSHLGALPSDAEQRPKTSSGAISPAHKFADVLDAARWLQEHVEVACEDRAVLLELKVLIEKTAERGDYALWFKALSRWNSCATHKIDRQVKGEGAKWRDRRLADIRNDSRGLRHSADPYVELTCLSRRSICICLGGDW